MSRSLKKGPFADAHLLKKVEAMNASGQKQVIKTSSRQFYHLPDYGWSHNCSTRWKKACSGICYRGYGWS